MCHPSFAVWIGLLVFSLNGFAADSPQWGGSASKNMASLEHNLPETFVPGEGTKGEIDLATTHHVKWVVSTGAFSCATPAIAGGKVFLATEKHLIVLAAGKEIKLLSRIDLGAASWVTPVAANGVLYIASKNKTGTA